MQVRYQLRQRPKGEDLTTGVLLSAATWLVTGHPESRLT
jgi:hypothetical protein